MMLKVENANQVHYSSYSNISTVSPDQINTRIKRDSNRSATAFKFTLSVDPDMDFGSCLTVMGSPQPPAVSLKIYIARNGCDGDRFS